MATKGVSGQRGTFKALTRDEILEQAKTIRRPVTTKPGMNPFEAGTSPIKDDKLRTVSEMGFDDDLLKQVPASVLALSVVDLEDFGRKMAGIDVTNPRVNALTIEDIQGIEALFADSKQLALAAVANRLAAADSLGSVAEVDVSCCCCTPCCCCAAAEIDPFAKT